MYECEVCGKRKTWLIKCHGCKRKLCDECIYTRVYYDLITGDGLGGFEQFLCKSCDDEHLAWGDTFTQEVEHHRQEMERMESDWRAACLKRIATDSNASGRPP